MTVVPLIWAEVRAWRIPRMSFRSSKRQKMPLIKKSNLPTPTPSLTAQAFECSFITRGERRHELFEGEVAMSVLREAFWTKEKLCPLPPRGPQDVLRGLAFGCWTLTWGSWLQRKSMQEQTGRKAQRRNPHGPTHSPGFPLQCFQWPPKALKVGQSLEVSAVSQKRRHSCSVPSKLDTCVVDLSENCIKKHTHIKGPKEGCWAMNITWGDLQVFSFHLFTRLQVYFNNAVVSRERMHQGPKFQT